MTLLWKFSLNKEFATILCQNKKITHQYFISFNTHVLLLYEIFIIDLNVLKKKKNALYEKDFEYEMKMIR